MKKLKKIAISLVIILAVIIITAHAVFQGEARTLLLVKQRGDTGIYEVNYAADYKLAEPLCRYEL